MSIHPSISDVLLGILFGSLSGIYLGILSSIYSGILSLIPQSRQAGRRRQKGGDEDPEEVEQKKKRSTRGTRRRERRRRRRRRRRSRGKEGEEGEEEDVGLTLLKSRDPHLTGGEKQVLKNASYNEKPLAKFQH